VILDVRFERIGNLHSRGSSVSAGGNFTYGKNRLGKNVLVEVNACNSKRGSYWGMSVNRCVDVGMLLIFI